MENRLLVSPSPHLKSPENIKSIMIDVLIALFPAAVAAIIFFRHHALLTMLVCTVAAMLTEAIILRSKNIFGDGSAAVTGLLLAMTLPPAPPWWLCVIGAVLAIVVGKQVFGGIGNNIFNPALVGRAILLVSWTGHMTGWLAPVDLTSTATPLASPSAASLVDLSLAPWEGRWEKRACWHCLGAAWLYRGHINWRIPGGYLLVVFVMGALLSAEIILSGKRPFSCNDRRSRTGGIFMATDMVTSPVTPKGQLIFGLGCGLVTMLVRLYGNYPEGVTFAILLMNALTPLLDNLTLPRKYGEVAKS